MTRADALPRPLANLRDRATRYEVAYNGRILGYAARKTRQTLLSYARANGDEILAALEAAGVPEDARWTCKNGVLDLGGGQKVYFTGRTERDAASDIARNAA